MEKARFSDETYKLASLAAQYWNQIERQPEEVNSEPKDAAEWAIDLLLACEEALRR